MAVAVKKDTEVHTGLPALGLAGASVVGTLIVVLGFVAAYHLVPGLWDPTLVEALGLKAKGLIANALNLVLMLGATAGVIFVLSNFVHQQDRPGLHAGIFLGVVFLLAGAVVVFLATKIAEMLADWFLGAKAAADSGPVLGGGVAVVASLLWFRFLLATFQKESFHGRLRALEDQGWFTLKAYKKGQGPYTRRGTMLGILTVVGCGLWVYAQRRSLIGAGLWAVDLPFDATRQIPLLWSPAFAVPLLVALATLWFAYRLVNYPRFADFLVATEAEMHKVSWSNRKRMIQDTIVVLMTLLLMTLLLFFVDFIWSTLLSLDWVRVIQTGSGK